MNEEEIRSWEEYGGELPAECLHYLLKHPEQPDKFLKGQKIDPVPNNYSLSKCENEKALRT